MTIQQVVAEYLDKKVGTGQCVPFAEQGLQEMYGVPQGAFGNAIDYANGSNQARLAAHGLVWHPGATSLIQDGDVLVWGPGTETGADGHIAFGDGGRIANQNNDGREYVTVDNFFASGLLGLYRKAVPQAVVVSSSVGAVTPWIGTVKTTTEINVRTGASTTSALNHEDPANTVCSVIGYVKGQDVTENGIHSNVWLIAGSFLPNTTTHGVFWSGGTNWAGVREI